MISKTLTLGETEKIVTVQEAERQRRKVKLDIRIYYLDSLSADHISDTERYLKREHKKFAEENGYKILCLDYKPSFFVFKPNYVSLALLIEDKETILEDEELKEIMKGNHQNPLSLLNKLFESDLVISSD